jgi:hypothetical protein
MKLKALIDDGGVSYENQHFPVVDGVVEVPDHLAPHLLNAGYAIHTEAEPAAAAEEEPVPAPKGKAKK